MSHTILTGRGLLAERGEVTTLTQGADAGDPAAADRLAELLAAQGLAW